MNNEDKVLIHKKYFKMYLKFITSGSIGGGIGLVLFIYFIGLAIGGPKSLSTESICIMIGIAITLFLMFFIPGLIIHLLIIRKYKKKGNDK